MSLTPENDEELKQLGFTAQDIDILKEKKYGMRTIQLIWADYWRKTRETYENQIQNQEDRMQLMEEKKYKIAKIVMNKLNSLQNVRNLGHLDDFESDEEDESEPQWAGKKTNKRKSNKRKSNKRKSNKRKSNKRKSNKKSKKYNKKGGAIYGTGVGSNCYDPNFSIYNTRELELFPYRP
jgi:hypothetical protein